MKMSLSRHELDGEGKKGREGEGSSRREPNERRREEEREAKERKENKKREQKTKKETKTHESDRHKRVRGTNGESTNNSKTVARSDRVEGGERAGQGKIEVDG